MFSQTSLTNRRQFLERSMLGFGSAFLLPSLLVSCTDHRIPDPNAPITLPSLGGVQIDWNNDSKTVVTTGIGMIPEVGEILSGLLDIFWPATKEDIWGDVKGQTEAMVNQQIAALVYKLVSEDLEGLQNSIKLYLNEVKNGIPSDIKTQWIVTRSLFAEALPHFQSAGNELPLMGLFVQFANMHLSLLRDGVIKGKEWGRSDADHQQDITDLKKAISDYTTYTTTWSTTGRNAVVNSTSRNDHKCQPFEAINKYDRTMTLTALDFMNTWYAYDVIQYPTGTKILLTREVYTEPYGTCDDSGLIVIKTPIPTQLPTQLTVWAHDRIDAVQLTYPAGSGPGGVTTTPRMGDQGGGTNQKPYGGVFNLMPDNPIIQVKVKQSFVVNALYFKFNDGTITDMLGGAYQEGSDTDWLFFKNHGLSSIHINGVSRATQSADCIVFGFQYWQSPAASLSAIGAIYIKSPKERSVAEFAKAFPNLTLPANLITEEYKTARQAYWAYIKASAEALK